MFITTQNEIVSLMPTARWDRPSQLFGYLEEEERVALEPLLGMSLYQHLCKEYERLKQEYVDITAATVRQTGEAKQDPHLAYADVTERLDQIQAGCCRDAYTAASDVTVEVSAEDMQTIRLIRICQQIEFYKMLSHKAGLLTVSFNEGGGMNLVGSDNYDPADEKAKDRVVKDAWMSAGRAVDSLLLFLEADAKGERLFTERWQEADAFYLHKDLLFQTARVFNEYLDIKGERMAYVQLVRDIRFCQNTYIKTSIGAKLLKAVVDWSNEANEANETYEELLSLLRTALAFFVEARRVEIGPKNEKLARRDSMTDAKQALAMACDYIKENLDALGQAAIGTPIYNNVREREAQERRDQENVQAACERRRREACEQNNRKIFTGFPATHRTPERK